MPSPKELEYMAEFKGRRRRWLRIMVPSATLLFGGVGVGIAFPALPKWVSLTAFGIGFLGSVICNRVANYRCPRCDTVPYGGEGTLVNPEVCAQCKLRFR